MLKINIETSEKKAKSSLYCKKCVYEHSKNQNHPRRSSVGDNYPMKKNIKKDKLHNNFQVYRTFRVKTNTFIVYAI